MLRMADLDPSGEVTTIIGEGLFEFGDVDGTLPVARFQHPLGVLHNAGNVLVADTYNHKIKLVDLELGSVHTLVGTGEPGHADGPGRHAQLSEPGGIALLDGNLYIADTNNHSVRVFEPARDELFTLRFTNEQALWPRPRRGFRGTRHLLPPVEVASNADTGHIRLEPPGGHVWNGDAPHHLEVLADDDWLEVGDVPEPDAGWDVEFPLRVTGEGTTNLRFRVLAYFCQEGVPEQCRFVAVELVLPVTVTEDGGPSVEATHVPTIDE